MTVCLPASANWYCSQIVDCQKSRGILAYGSRNDLVFIKLLLDDTNPEQLHINYLRTMWVHHNVRVSAVRFCPYDSHPTLLASVGDDCLVSVVDSESEAIVFQHTVHRSGVTCVDWLRLNEHAVCVVSGDENGHLVVANITSKKTRSHSPVVSKPISTLASSPLCPNLVAVGYLNGLVIVMDLHAESNEESIIFQKNIHGQAVQSICWAPFRGRGPLLKVPPATDNIIQEDDGDSTDLLVASGSRDGTIRVWSANGGDVIATFTTPSNVGSRSSKRSFEDKRAKLMVAVHWPEHEPTLLLSSSYTGSFLRWNLLHQSGSSSGGGKSTAWSVVGHNQPAGKQHASSIFSITSYKGVAVTVSMDRHIMFWRVTTGIHTWLANVPTLCGFVYQLAFSPFNSGLLAFGCGDQTIKTWNLTTKSDPFDVTTLWQGIRSHVMSIGWHPTKESLLAFGTKDGRVGLYDVLANRLLGDGSHSRELKKLVNVYVVCWGPAPKSSDDLGIYSCGGGIVSVHDPRNLDKPAVDIDRYLFPNLLVKSGASRYSDVVWNADHTVLALGNDDGVVFLYRASNLTTQLAAVESRGKQIRSMTWHPEFTLSTTAPSKFRRWLAFATRGSKFYVHNFDPVFEETTLVGPAEVAGTPMRCDHELGGHTDEVPCVAWNPHLDGQLVSASYDGTVKVWDAFKGEVLACYCGHMSKVLTCAWSPLEPNDIFSGGTDYSVHVWRVSEQPREPTVDAIARRSQQKERMLNVAPKNTKKTPRKSSYQQSPNTSNGSHPSVRSVEANVTSPNVETSTTRAAAIDIHELIEQRKREILARGDQVTTLLDPSANRSSLGEGEEPPLSPEVKREELPVVGDSVAVIADKLEVVSKTRMNVPNGKSNKKNKKNTLAKSIFPQTNLLDNSCGKATNLEDCVLLANRMCGGAEGDVGADFGCGAQTHLGIYGQRVDTYRLLKSEADKHASSDNLDFALQLEVWKGNVSGALKMAMENEQLSDWLVAMAATASQSRYVEVCELYAKQLVRSGNPRKAVLYLLAIDKVHEAIDVLKKNVSHMEAVILAKVRLSQKDPLIGQLLEERAVFLAERGQVEVAAKCYIGSGNPEKAAALLCHKQDAAGLRVSAFIAKRCGDSQKASSYASQAMSECLLVQDFETAATLIKEHPQLKSCELVLLAHRHLIDLWQAHKESGIGTAARVNSNEADDQLIFILRRIWASVGILGNDEDDDVIEEHLRVLQSNFLPFKPRTEAQVLAFLATSVSTSTLHVALGNGRASLDELLACFAIVHQTANTAMLVWWTRALKLKRSPLQSPVFEGFSTGNGNDAFVLRALEAYTSLAQLHQLLDTEQTLESRVVIERDADISAALLAAATTEVNGTQPHSDTVGDVINGSSIEEPATTNDDTVEAIKDIRTCPSCQQLAAQVTPLLKTLLDADCGELGELSARLVVIQVALAGALARRKCCAVSVINSSDSSVVVPPVIAAASDKVDENEEDYAKTTAEEDVISPSTIDSRVTADAHPTAVDLATTATNELLERAVDISVEALQKELLRIEEKRGLLENVIQVKHFPDVLTSARLLVTLCSVGGRRCSVVPSGCPALRLVQTAAAQFGVQHSAYPKDLEWFGTHLESS